MSPPTGFALGVIVGFVGGWIGGGWMMFCLLRTSIVRKEICGARSGESAWEFTCNLPRGHTGVHQHVQPGSVPSWSE